MKIKLIMQKQKLSTIVAGTMNWGAWGKKLSETEMAKRIEFCLENNVSSFDHADIYGGYTTEAEFGKAFTASKIDRKNVQFITKCGIQSVADNRSTTIKHYNYSRAHIIKSVDNSLQNLQTDYIDVVLLHRPSPLLDAHEVADTVFELIRDGKIMEFGLSNFSPLQTELLREKIKVEYNQIQFSATNLDAMSDGSLDYMQSNHIHAMAWNPLGSTFKSNDEKSIRVKAISDKLGLKYNVSAEVILFAWIQKHPANILPVFGTTDFDRIRNLAKSSEVDLQLEDYFAIWEANLGRKVD